VQDYKAFFAGLVETYRFHQVVAGGGAVAGGVFVDVEAVETVAAVVAAGVRRGWIFVMTILADVAFINCYRVGHWGESEKGKAQSGGLLA
jgi:hypothetical protein